MLDAPLAHDYRTLGDHESREAKISRLSPAWHPRLVLLPSWGLSRRVRFVKRLVDICFSVTALIALMLPALFVMLAIRLESPGPILFRQQRIGLRGRQFTTLKFRTMYWCPDDSGIIRQATRDDPRITKVGQWLRRYSVDELPQVINVLRGEMSIVGPRPHAPGTRAGGQLFEDVVQCYDMRHYVKPGLTGLAQVRGWRGETDTKEKLLHRIDCDFEYITRCSFGLDMAIIWWTARYVLRMRNAY